MSEVKVFGVPQSSYTWSARLALTEKGVEHELVISPPRSEQQSARHPFDKVPALVHGVGAYSCEGGIRRIPEALARIAEKRGVELRLEKPAAGDDQRPERGKAAIRLRLARP